MKTAAIEEILHHRGHKGPNHETTAVKTWQRTISLTDYELNTEILLDADIFSIFQCLQAIATPYGTWLLQVILVVACLIGHLACIPQAMELTFLIGS